MRSVGYSDLFVLSKKDMWDVLKEYPAARVRLEAIAVKRLEKYKRAPLEKGSVALLFPWRSVEWLAVARGLTAVLCLLLAAALGRSQSTPGLVESRGRVPLEEMWISPIDPVVSTVAANSMFSPSHSPTVRLMSGLPGSAGVGSTRPARAFAGFVSLLLSASTCFAQEGLEHASSLGGIRGVVLCVG